MGTSTESLLVVLESDLRLLSSETRRAEGFTGWLTGPDHLAVKEAAERAVLKLRSLASSSDPSASVAASKDILRPFLMGLESKSIKLVSISLISIQKLSAYGALSDEGILSVAAAVEQVERLMHEDYVQLKILQTALSLMQSLQVARLEEAVRIILGVCFRLLGAARNSDSVVSTAVATVRQAVALVFEHISLESGQQQATSLAIPDTAEDVAHLDPGSAAASDQTHAAALQLLGDLCAMSSGGQHTWLQSPVLLKPFVLELLDFVLNASADVFRTVPAFENALMGRVCTATLGHMRVLLDPACDSALQSSELKVMLRVVRSLLRQFHVQLKAKCGAFVEALLAGAAPECTLLQRISVMLVLRQLCEDAHMVHFLFVAYDQRWEVQLDAVQAMLGCCASTIESNSKTNSEFSDEDPVVALGLLYLKQPQGRDGPLDSDHGQVSIDSGMPALTMLAISGVLGIAAAINELTRAAICEAPDQGQGISVVGIDRETCTEMAEKCFDAITESLGFLLARSASDPMTNQLLEGIRSFTEACVRLDLAVQRDILLRNLNHLCISLDDSDILSDDGSTTSGYLRPVAAAHMWLAGTEGVQLSHKNVAALGTLFGIASSLEHLLAGGWNIVLGTINCLDCILASPRTTSAPQEGLQHTLSGPTAIDLAALSSAANLVFESTVRMSGESVVGLLAALHDVSAASLSSAALQPGTVKLYALSRMVDVLHFNMGRIYDLWGIFLAHVLEVLGSPKSGLRDAALDALGRAINGALARPAAAAAATADSQGLGGYGSSTESDSDAASGVEHMLLVALTALYTPDREVDVRLGVLRVALTVLQRHGERLTTGWLPILRLLAAVPERGEAEAISLAFQSVQLMCSDFLWSLPPHQLRKCLEVAALYAGQKEDLNVSLTAISQLWNAADFLAHVRPGHLQPSDARHSEEGSTTLDATKYEELLELILNAMQGLSTDTRPEVRNSGVRTLYSVVVSHGTKLSEAQWRQCFWGILFPLLRTVHHMSVTSSREEAAAEVLGKLRGESVTMLVHHSRNSAQKQWDETLVLALQGMGRLLRAHLPVLVMLEGFPAGWQELMLVCESSMAGGRKDTAIAAIGCLTAVLQAHSMTGVVDSTMWKRAMRALDVGVEAAASPQCAVPLQARLELITAIGTLQSQLRPAFDESDLQLLFLWLEKFVRNPWSADDTSSPVPGLLLPVQRAALAVFPAIAPLPTTELWLLLFSTLLRLLKPQDLKRDTNQGEAGELMHKAMLTSLTMEKTVEVLVGLFRDRASAEVQSAIFAPLVEILGRCMATRHVVPQDDLWRTAAAAFNSVVVAGLPAINIASARGQPVDEAWETLAAALEVFLLAETGVGRSVASAQHSHASSSPEAEVEAATSLSARDLWASNAEVEVGPAQGSAPVNLCSSPSSADDSTRRAAADAELEVNVLDTLTDQVLTMCQFASNAIRRRLVQIVDRGIHRPAQLNFRPAATGISFEHVCLRKLYVLSSRGEGSLGPDGCMLEVAQIAFPTLLARAQRILETYAAEQCIAATETRGRGSMADVMCVLEVAAIMTLSPVVVNSVSEQHVCLRELLPVMRRGHQSVHTRERAHLLILYPSLVECIPSRDPRVQELLKDVLKLAGCELRLQG